MFSVSLLNTNRYYIVANLELGATVLATLFCDGYLEYENNQCSITVVTECSAGAAVRNVCAYSVCSVLGGRSHNVFSGVFLSNIN